MRSKFIFAIIILGITTACTIKKEVYSSLTNGNAMFYAKNGDDLGTKTVLKSDGAIQWCPNERINLFYGTSAFVFTSTNTQEASEVEFHGTLDGIEYADGEEFWAIYPYNESNSFNGESATVTLPVEQKAVSGTFDDELFLSMAKTRNNVLQFYNVCGGVRFTVTQDDVVSVTFNGNNNESIAGQARIGWNADGRPTVKSIINPLKTVTLKAPDGETFEIGKWYYIVCFPATLTKGYSLTLNTKHDAHTTRKSNNTVIIKRSVWGSLEDVDLNLLYDIPQNEIWYTTTDNKPLSRLPHVFSELDSDGGGYDIHAQLISNTYEDGLGILKYEEPIVNVGQVYSPGDDFSTLKTIIFPSSMTTIGRVGRGFPNHELAVISGALIEGYSYWNPFPNSPKLKYAGPNSEIIPNYLVVGRTLVSFAEGCGLADVDISGYPFSSIGVNTIGQSCFSGNTSLTRINIGAPITTINRNAFENCNALTSASVADGVTLILSSTFDSCQHLSEVSLPTTLVTICEDAFLNCKELKQIQLPESLNSIRSSAFLGSGLTSVEIPASVTGLGDGSFLSCPLEVVTMRGTTPPECIWYPEDESYNESSWRPFDGDCPIIVPKESLSAYKTANNWSKYKSRFYSTMPFVDLGLPSGVKWATMNIGASSPEEFGDYYAWGETETKSNYSWATYSLCNGTGTTLTKYNSKQSYGTVDNKSLLETGASGDDVASKQKGGKWRIPTRLEWLELVDNCSWTRATVEGVNGYKVTSNIDGFTDRVIFLPAAGVAYETSVSNASSQGGYWSSNGGEMNADYLYFYNGNVSVSSHYRYMGRSIRPVVGDCNCIAVGGVSLDRTELSLGVGESTILKAFITPSNASVKAISWSSSNDAVAMVSSSGVINGIYAGNCTITATTIDGGFKATCDVTVSGSVSYTAPQAIDLGLSVYWGSFNLGGNHPEDFGAFFAWGEVETKSSFSSDNYKWRDSEGKYTKYCSDSRYGIVDNKTSLDSSDDAASYLLGSHWRMPTHNEIVELVTKCEFAKEYINGTAGFRITGPSGNSIFIPCAGTFWSSTHNSNSSTNLQRPEIILFSSTSGAVRYSSDSWCACGLEYVEGIPDSNAYNAVFGREWGCPIRPVYVY